MSDLRFERVTLENFKSFRGHHSIPLSGDSSLTLVAGINEQDKALGANGAGKSTIFDAISYCLYGKTLRGVKSSNIRTWTATEGSFVEIHLADGLPIKRSWNPNFLTHGDKVVTQEYILDLLGGLTFEEFRHSIVLGQFSQKFLDLLPADKLALFTNVLSIDFWTECSKKAATESKHTKEENMLQNKLDIVKADEGIRCTEEELKTAKEDAKVKSKALDSEKAGIEEAIEREDEVIVTNNRRHTEALDEREASFPKIDKMKAEISALDRQIGDIESSRNLMDHQAGQMTRALTDIEVEKERILSLPATCEVCFSEVSESVKEKQVEALDKKYKDTEFQADDLIRHMEEVKETQENMREVRNPMMVKYRSLEAKINDLLREADDCDTKAKIAAGSIRMLRNNKDKIELEAASLDLRVDDTKEKLNDMIANREKLENDKKLLEANYEATAYWVDGFKQIRFAIIKEALASLEIETNNCLIELGLPNWSISYDIEKQTKSGSLQKGLHVFIKSPRNAEPVPWECWSGGESQRLKLASEAALATLISDSKGVLSNIEVWDEPSSHLSEKGVDSLLEFLHLRAIRNNKQVFLVDHTSLEHGSIRRKIMVRKDQDGNSSISE